LLALLALLAGCQGEPGPPGLDGRDGADGADGAGEGGGGLAAPSDLYFSVAVTSNGLNHSGERSLFLDFADAEGAFDVDPLERGNRVVGGLRVEPGAITVDASLSEWEAIAGSGPTSVIATPQSNYPLSRWLDAVPVEIELQAAYDETWVYLAMRWEDASHRADARGQQWVFGDQGNGEAGWNRRALSSPDPAAPEAAAVNLGDSLFGLEDEDRVFFMWPLEDPAGHFAAEDGLGCAAYCHANANDSDDPDRMPVGAGVANMHTNLPGERVDLWHWQGARNAATGFLGDGTLEHRSDAFVGGFEPDWGRSPSVQNGAVGPERQSWLGLSVGDQLWTDDAVLLTDVPVDGDFVPGYLLRVPTGSSADVRTAARFDGSHWTLEMQRLRNTGSGDDVQFIEREEVPSPPVDLGRAFGDPAAGATAYMGSSCINCHGPGGVGIYDNGLEFWVFPRVQRATSGSIRGAIAMVPEMMGFMSLSDQEVEDIAAYLQEQYLPAP
jgi:cytochrome c553